jgi:GlcNAc-P-P-Und epimerase
MSFKNIHILGGSGFVGTRLISILESEFIVQNIDIRKSVKYSDITSMHDICYFKAEDINLKKSDFIVLLAAEHRDDVSPISKYYKTNVDGTENVLNQMNRVGCKHLIFTSSVAVYGLNKNHPNEDSPVDPFNHYGKSKLQAEEVIKKWYKEDPINRSVSIIRPTVIFGENNRGNVYNLLRQIASGRFLMIGTGENKKSMAYVGNVVAFIKNRLENAKPGFHVFNYVDKPDFSMTELVSVIQKTMDIKIPKTKIPYWIGMICGFGFDILASITGKKLSISSIRVKKFCSTSQFNVNKANSIFKAPYSLEEGLNKTLEHEFINPKEEDVLFYSE